MKKNVFVTGICGRSAYLTILVFLLSLSANAQFQIVGMLYKGKPAESVNLIILVPNASPFNGPVNFDPNKVYNSGTTFKTPDSTSISILCKGQKQIMRPNSTLTLTIENNGITAKIKRGSVQHFLHDVKEKLSFYKAGNGYTWAHAEGTIFEVEAYEKSKKMKFSTQEGTIAVIEEVPIKIIEKTKNPIDSIGKADERQLFSSKKTLVSAGEEYISNIGQPIVYETYEDALKAIDNESTKNDEAVDLDNRDPTQKEELADHYTLLGGLYLENGQSDKAIEPLRKALKYHQLTNPEGLLTTETNLYLSEALIHSGDINGKIEGEGYAKEIIKTLENKLYKKIDDLGYATKNKDFDLVWDIKNKLVAICKYLGWSYDLLEVPETAKQYYDFAHEFSND